MGQQEPVARIAVADQNQRIRCPRPVGFGVAHGLPDNLDLGLAVTQEHAHRLCAGRARPGRIPDLDRQRPVIARQVVGLGGSRVDGQDVHLIRVDQIQRPHADGVIAIGGQIRRIGTLPVDTVLGSRYGCSGNGRRRNHGFHPVHRNLLSPGVRPLTSTAHDGKNDDVFVTSRNARAARLVTGRRGRVRSAGPATPRNDPRPCGRAPAAQARRWYRDWPVSEPHRPGSR